MGYKDLEIWQEARQMSVEIHKMTLSALPKFEMFEKGSQIRRSSHSVRSNIVEGYGRRKYINDYLKFLTYAISSNDETLDHLEALCETGSLADKEIYKQFHKRTETLGKKLNKFIAAVESRK